MPPVAAGIAAAAAAAGASAAVATAIGSFAVKALVSIAISVVTKALAPKPKGLSADSFANIKSSGATQQFRQPISARRIVYGEARVSGAIVYAGVTNSNKYLHLVITLASHEIEEIGEIIINDESFTDNDLDGSGFINNGKYKNRVRIKKYLGTTTQTADSDLVAEVDEWTTDHRLQEIAYVYVRLQWNRNTFPAGIPNFSFWVRGKKTLDTRDDVTRYSPNPAFMARDYLTETRSGFGFGVASDNIDADFTDSQANTCEEMVITGNYQYEVDAVDTTNDWLETIDDRLFLQRGDQINISSSGDSPLKSDVVNYALHSEGLEIWRQTRGAITSDQTTAPDGTTTADLFTEDTATGGHYVFDDFDGINVNETMTASIYVKPNGRFDIRIEVRDLIDTGNRVYSDFDVSDGTITADYDLGDGQAGSSSIEDAGDGWYRISVTGIASTTTSTDGLRVFYYIKDDDGANQNYTGDGTSGAYFWGAQLEKSDTLGHYVKTEGNQVSDPVDYYAIPYQRKDSPKFRVATSLANSFANTYVDITSAGSGVITVTKVGEPRYMGGGVLEVSAERGNNLLEIVSAMSGQAVNAGGKWRVHAGEYRTPTISFDESDLVGAINVDTKAPKSDRFNEVQGVYVSQTNDGNPSDYPLVKNSTYQTNDGEVIRKTLDLSFTQRPHTAQRIAKQALERGRQDITFTAPFKLTAFKVQVGDNFYFSFEKYGWTNKIFEVIEWSLVSDNGTPAINLTVRENASGVYDWNSGEETTVDLAVNTSLPNPFNVSPIAGFSLDSVLVDTQGGDKIFKVFASWDLSADEFVLSGGKYEVEYRESTETIYSSAGVVDGGVSQLEVVGLKPDTLYDLRIIAYNNLNVSSAETIIEDFVVGTTVTTNTEDWENETLARDGDDWETDTLTNEDWA